MVRLMRSAQSLFLEASALAVLPLEVPTMSTNCFRTAIRFLAAVLFSASIAAPALAQQSGGQGTRDRFLDFFRRTELSGFVDGYYGYNFNTPGTRKAGPESTFDWNHHSISLNLAGASLGKK